MGKPKAIISIHGGSFIMAERRMISAKMFQDEFYGKLSFLERQVWIGLIVVCVDDQGRCSDNAKLINADIFPYDEIPNLEINTVLQKFADANKIIRYEANGQKIIQIVSWWKNQQGQWAGRSVHPAPPGWTDKVRCHEKGNVLTEENWKRPGGLSTPLSCQLSTPLSRREDEDDVKDEDEARDPACLSPLSTAFVNATGIPELTGGPQRWTDALSDLGKAGVEPIDVETAVKELKDKNYSIVNLRSIVNAAISAMSKRTKPGSNSGRPIKPPTTAVQTPKDWHA